MPVLVQVARIADVSPGTSRRIEVRGRKILLVNVGGVFHALEDRHSLPGIGVTEESWAQAADGTSSFRTQVRAPFVYVALDADREHAPSDVHEIGLHRVP